MQDWLSATVGSRPDGLALLTDSGIWTYRTLNDQVARMCHALNRLGVHPGVKIGVLMPNRAEYVMLIHALARLGGVLVPLNTRLTGEELAFQVDKSGCVLMIHSSDIADKTDQFPVRRVLYESLSTTANEAAVCDQGTVDLDDVQALVFTSGTTGKPKGAQITYGNYFHGANASAWRLGTLPEDRWLTCLPLYHVGGLAIIWRCCLYGTTVVLHDGFNVERVREAFASQSITLISLVPTMLNRLLEARVVFPPSLRLVLLGGAAANPALIERCAALNLPIATTYGLTETASQVATMLPAEVRRKPGSVGKPLTFTSVQVVDTNGLVLPTGEIGEIVVCGPTVMKGYLGHADTPSQHANVLYTGDVGYLDADGDLWIVQRRQDLIVSGGENIYPTEIENVISQHPAVAEVCVVGLPDDEWGQIVAAAIRLHAEKAMPADELTAFCKQHLASYKCPRLIRYFDKLPQTGSGKINRQRLAEELRQGN